MKYEVLEKVTLTVNKGSIVDVDERQYEVARHLLKPVELKSSTEEKKPKAKKK